jgi:DNA-binding NarL/FixJ family response regulator
VTPIRVICVDDNRLMAEAMERRLELEPRLQWAGWVEDASGAAQIIRERRPDIVLLDIDMPGHDPFELLAELTRTTPDVRVIMFSGHIRTEYINKAVDGGAWGYVSKNESLDEVMAAILRVADGEFILTPDVTLEYRRATP